jgi:hypothetical protein
MSIQVFNNDASVAAKAAEQKSVEGTESVSAAEAAGQKQAEATETSEADATEAKEAESEADAESSEEGEAVEAKESEESEKQKPKKKGGWQRKTEKAEREAEAAKRELEYWKSVAMKNAGDSKPEQKAEPKAPVKTDGEPDPDQFETHKDYVKALAKWEAKQILKERDAETEKSKLMSEQEKLVKAHLDREKSFAEKTEDYREAVESIDDVMFPAYTQQLLLESELGPELIYELAKNREMAERISKLAPLAASKELGKLEARIASRASDETKKPEPKKQTQAPAPITPVGAKGGKVEKSISDPNISQREYEALRRKQIAARQSSW